MRKRLVIISTVLLSLAFAACSDLDKSYNKETVKEDLEAIKEELDSADRKILGSALIRMALSEGGIEDKTYAEILDQGREWEKERLEREEEAKRLADEAAAEEAERVKALTNAVMVTVFDKGFTKHNYDDYITYKFAIQNKSDKNIRAIKGSVVFNNIFDEKIKQLDFVYDKPIKAKSKAVWDATSDYNQFMDSDKALKAKALKDLKIVWVPEKIIFEDGTTLE